MANVDLNLLKVFMMVAQQGSFIQAANKLSMPSSNVSRAISQLEAQVNCRLIARTTRRMRLTEKGTVLYQQGEYLLSELSQTLSSLSESTGLQGQFKITIPGEGGSQLLAPIITQFALLHPQLTLLCDTQFIVNDIIDDDIDLLLTFNRGQLSDSSYHAKCIKKWESIVVASPKLIERIGLPDSIEALVHLPCITSLSAIKGQPWQFIDNQGKLHKVNVQSHFRVNSGFIAGEAAVQGLGFAILSKAACLNELAAGRLVEVPFQLHPAPFELIAIYASNRYLSQKISQFLAFLTQQLQ